MSLKRYTPCDTEGHCPYDVTYNCDCEWYCGADEPEDKYDYEYESWKEKYEYKYGKDDVDDCDYEVGYDPYCGCFTDDC